VKVPNFLVRDSIVLCCCSKSIECSFITRSHSPDPIGRMDSMVSSRDWSSRSEKLVDLLFFGGMVDDGISDVELLRECS